MDSKPYYNKVLWHRLKNSDYLKVTRIESKRCINLKRELLETRDKLHSLIDTVPGGIAIFRIGETVETIFFNDAVCALVGINRAEYNLSVKNDIMVLVYHQDRKILITEIENALKEKRHIDCVFRVNHKAGHQPWVHLFAVNYKQEEGNPIFHAVFLDITREIEDKKEIESANEKLVYRADYDMLTGIYNRQAFFRETAKMLENNREKKYILLCLDVERFKVINDLFGTEIGDEVLRKIALDFKKNLKKLGTYGRLEADHFACCFPEENFSAEIVLERIDRVINSININYAIVVNFGVYPIDDISLQVGRMCDRANLALRTIKGNYLKKYAFYDEKLRNTILKEQQITNEMDHALKSGQFKIHLQPIYCVATEKLVSAEALVRWYHPQRGLISPADFIPLFERNGFISKLDAYVWEEVCKFIASEKKKGHAVVPISVNVSRINLYNVNLCSEIIALTKKYGTEPELLKFEITESAYTDNPQQLLKAMSTLQKHGFEVLMDDFGSGYSSLNMLKDVPVDILKIDMKFIEDLDVSSRAGSVMTNVIRMAKWLNMSVVAEGVETKAQLVVLRNIGCDKVQGYYLSKPLTTDDFEKLMAGEEPDKAEKTYKMNEVDINCIWEADQKFTKFISGMVEGMGIFEIVGNEVEIVRANDGYFEIMGGTAKDLFSKKNNILEHIFQEDRDKLIHSLALAVKEKCAQGLNIRKIHKNGNVIWTKMRISYLGKLGDNDAFYFAINDISHEKKLENDVYLRQYGDAICGTNNEVLLFNYTDNCIVPILKSNFNNFKKMCGDNLYKAVQDYSENEVHPQDKNIFLELYDKEKLERFFQRDEKTNIDTEIRIKENEGEFQWVLIRTLKLEDPFGKSTFLSCIKIKDAKKKADTVAEESIRLLGGEKEQRHKAELEVENTNSMLENILRHTPAGIGIYQITDKVIPLYLSDEWCKLFGFSREVRDRHISQKQPMDFNFEGGLMPEHFDELIIKNETFKKVIKGCKKDGTPKTLRITGTFKKDDDDRVIMYSSCWEEEEFVETKITNAKPVCFESGHSSVNFQQKTTILIVDDDAGNRKILRKILDDSYNVLEAENNVYALELLNKEKASVAVILLDIIKPARDGYCFLDEVKCDTVLSEIPVIVITAENNKDAEKKAICLGAKDFLAMPFKKIFIKQRIASHIKLKETTNTKNAVEKIINNLPGGVCIFEIGDKIRTTYISDGLSNICGYSVEEYFNRFGDDITKIVYHEDLERVTESIYKSKNAHQSIDVEYHINCRNGDMGYSRIQANFVYEDSGVAVYYGVISDITAKEVEMREHYERESAFRRSITGDTHIFFECDLVTGKIISVDERTVKYMHLSENSDCMDMMKIAIANIIHPEDRELFDEIRNKDRVIENISNGKKEIYIEYRYSSMLKNFIGYRWANAMLSYIINPKTNHPHVFVCIRDINEQKTKSLDMMEKAQKDFLTGLFNRSAFQELAQKAIDESKDNGSISAFLIIDLDDFKKINDSYGHVYGDAVLKRTTQRLGTVFRSNDILGRLGGDEMTVFMTNIPSADIAVKKGFEICRILGSWRKDDEKIPITCSVGVAVMPEHGHTLEKLYYNADMALYQAKSLGKNRCCLFDEKTTLTK